MSSDEGIPHQNLVFMGSKPRVYLTLLNFFILRSNSFLLGLKTGEGLNLKQLDGGVELLLGILSLVLGSGNSNSDESWHVSAALGLDEPVKLGVHSHILKILNGLANTLSELTLVNISLMANLLMSLTA